MNYVYLYINKMSMIIFNKQDYIYRKSLDIIKLDEGYIQYTSSTRSKIVTGKNNSSLLVDYKPTLLTYYDKRSEKYQVSVDAGILERNFLFSSIIMNNPYIDDIFLSNVSDCRDIFDCVIKDINGNVYIIEIKLRNFSSTLYDGDLIMSKKYHQLIEMARKNDATPLYLMYFKNDSVLRIYNLFDIECDFGSNILVSDCVGCNKEKVITSDFIPTDCSITKQIKIIK